MFRTQMIGSVSAAALILSGIAFAQQGGTAQEARAMLDKAIAAVKADQVVAIAMFVKGEGGFLDRDLYPFCFRIADGKTLASPKAVPAGTDVRTLKDASGNAYGLAIYAAAQKPEGQITEVPSYMFPKPGVRRQIIWDFWRRDRVEDLAHLRSPYGYDEPEILLSLSHRFCPMSADAGSNWYMYRYRSLSRALTYGGLESNRPAAP